MVFQCCTWIVYLIRQLLANNDVEYFSNVPDDVIVDILSRVPIQTLGQCGKVCKKWHMLTSSSHFIGLHIQKRNEAKPLTLLHIGSDHPKLFIIDGSVKKECKVQALHAKFVGSCNGLVLFESAYYFCIYFVFNLSSGRMTKLDTTDTTIFHGIPDGSYFYPCGFFFHPRTKEFRILHCLHTGIYNAYYLYLFGAKMWRRTFHPYFRYHPEHESWRSPKDFSRTPVTVNGRLHWYTSDKIMIFDMFSEEFCVKPLPIKKEYLQEGSYYMRDLLEENDQLYFCNLRYEEKVLEILILHDYANWSWTRKYIVDLDSETKFPMNIDLKDISVFSIHKDELILSWSNRGLFSYHLGCNSIKKNVVKVQVDRCTTARNHQYWGYGTYKP